VPSDSIISRTDADTLIPTEQADAVIKAATQESAAHVVQPRPALDQADPPGGDVGAPRRFLGGGHASWPCRVTGPDLGPDQHDR
jgi:hypothetical protein